MQYDCMLRLRAISFDSYVALFTLVAEQPRDGLHCFDLFRASLCYGSVLKPVPSQRPFGPVHRQDSRLLSKRFASKNNIFIKFFS